MKIWWSWPASLLLALLPAAWADEAILPDGQRRSGKLVLDEGRLRFHADQRIFALDKIHRIERSLPEHPLKVWPLQVRLRRDEQVSGEILQVDAGTITLRTAWAKRLEVPRRCVAAIVHPADLALVHQESFDKKPAGWTGTGVVLGEAPARNKHDGGTGISSLKLAEIGQKAEWKLPVPLAAGRLGFDFHVPEAADARWLLSARFGGKEPANVVIELAGPAKEYQVESQVAGKREALPCRPGWHRFELRFSSEAMLIGVDGKLLWSSDDGGPTGPLVRLVFSCERPASVKERSSAAVYVDNLILLRTLAPRRHLPGDPRQDEIWLISGDQLFGKASVLDAAGVRLDTRFGPQRIAWKELRGVYFRPLPCNPSLPRGDEKGAKAEARVRLELSTGTPTRDHLNGVVKRLGDRQMILAHPVLGELAIDLDYVAGLRGARQ